MADIGKYYVQIIPSAQGIGGKIEQAIAPQAKATGTSLGHKLAANMGVGLKMIGSAMTSYITVPAMGAVTALGGATLFAGWKRMTAIDNAKVKLQAIGNSAKDMERITVSAMESVKGTAYGMDAAMTTSASAVAAGIKPGKELTHYLTTISDAAAVAGTDMSSMGAIFNKVAASGKAQNDVLSQLAEAGIPIYQYLAEEMGVTTDEVFKLASAGEVGLAEFESAVSNHIGGAAKEIGSKTITGAISNVKAAISRIGANFLGSADDADSFAGKILPMLNNLMDNLEPIEEKAKELGSQFADVFGKFANAISKIPLPVLVGIAGALVSIGPAIQMFTLLSSAMSFLGITLSGPVIAIGAIVAALALAYARVEPFRNAVNELIIQIGTALMPVLQTVGSFLKVLISEVMSIASAIGNALAPVIQLLTPVISFLVTLVGIRLKVAFTVATAVVRSIANAIKAALAIIQGFAQALSPLVPKVTAVFNAVKNAITHPIETAKNLIKGIVDKIKGFFSFSVKAPHIPLPHFSIKPAGWKVGDLLDGKIPSLGISWYAKGGIANKPVIGVGEAGPEAILPLDPFWKKLERVAGGSNNDITINVYGAEGQSPKAIALEVKDILIRETKQRRLAW